MWKRLIIPTLLLITLIVSCKNGLGSDINNEAKKERYKQAVVTEINTLIDKNKIDVINSTSKSLKESVNTDDHFTFIFTNEEESIAFQKKIETILQDIYGENWKEMVQSERVDYPIESEFSVVPKGDYVYGQMKYGNGWWYAIFTGHAWAYSQQKDGRTCSYLYASLRYQYHGPYHTNYGYQTVTKYNTTKASSDIWTAGFPAADMVTADGSKHIITYSGTTYGPRYIGNY